MAILRYLPVIQLLLYRLTRYLFVKLQSIYWMFNGIHKRLILSKKPKGYKSCVHVQDIQYRFALDSLITNGQTEDFVTTHHSFTSPIALLADNVSLYCINSKEAIFVKTDPSIDVYNSNTAAFMKVAQYKYSTQILVMPMQAFHRFAEELGDPESKVVLLSSTGRCGSTLFGQILEATGECVAMSEPWAFFYPCYNQDNYHQGELQQVMCNILRVLCKPQISKYKPCYIIKVSPTNVGIVPFITKGMPQVKQLFMYRDPWNIIRSAYRTFYESTEKRILIDCFIYSVGGGEFLECSARKLLRPQRMKELWQMLDSSLAFSVAILTSALFQYLHFQEQGLPVQAFRYEDLLSNSQKCMEVLFKYLDLHVPLDLLPKGLEAMSRDSQRGSSISKKNTEAGKDLGPYSGKNKELVEKMFNIFRIPIPDRLMNLPGTITNTDN